MSFDLKSLGFTQEDLQERVIDRICENLLSSTEYSPDDGREYPVESRFKTAIDKRVKEQIDATINALAQKHVLPNVSQYIEELTIQQTNQWGEKKGSPVTFIEYLISRAQDYMREEVNSAGKSKAECDSYGWTGTKQTRITHLIHGHLHYSIETAMKDALKVATGEIARGIHETARLKLNEIAAGMKVAVTAK